MNRLERKLVDVQLLVAEVAGDRLDVVAELVGGEAGQAAKLLGILLTRQKGHLKAVGTEALRTNTIARAVVVSHVVSIVAMSN